MTTKLSEAPTAPAPRFTAACRCGAFSLASTSAPVVQLVCHCHQCREASGAAFSEWAMFKVKDTQTHGAAKVLAFKAASGHATTRELCVQCGDMLIDRTEGFPRIVGVVAGRLQGGFQFQPAHHVWTDDKLPSVTIPHGVTAFARQA